MVETEIHRIWVYLAASPLLWLTVTLVAYQFAYQLYQAFDANPLFNPVLIAVALLIAVLWGTETDYATYFDGAQFVHFLLGPAIVALAVPLYKQMDRLRALWLPIALALIVGVSVSTLTGVGFALLFGGSRETLLSLAPKSVTTPVAMGISEKIGGIPSLTAVLVVTTGIIGAVIGTKLFDLLRVKDEAVRGVALGVTSHGIGTARAYQVSTEMGAFSGLAMALSAFATSVIVPWLLRVFGLLG